VDEHTKLARISIDIPTELDSLFPFECVQDAGACPTELRGGSSASPGRLHTWLRLYRHHSNSADASVNPEEHGPTCHTAVDSAYKRHFRLESTFYQPLRFGTLISVVFIFVFQVFRNTPMKIFPSPLTKPTFLHTTVFYPSIDGTKVRCSSPHKSLAQHIYNSLLLYIYGGFGISVTHTSCRLLTFSSRFRASSPSQRPAGGE